MSESGESSKDISDNISLQLDAIASSSTNAPREIDELASNSEDSKEAVSGSIADAGDPQLKSMIRSTCTRPKRNVQFPCDEELVQYREPFLNQTWLRRDLRTYTKEEVLERYTAGCNKAHIVVQDSIMNQLHAVQCNTDYTAVLNLSGLVLDCDMINTLEPIFDMVTFRAIYLDKGSSCYIMDIFDMLEFYDPVRELVLTNIDRDDAATWHSIANVISNSRALKSVAFRDMMIWDSSLRILFEEGFNCGTVRRIRFDACGLNKTPTFMLAHLMKNNVYVKELHLCYLDLYSREAEIIGKYLSNNLTLRILDLSNNKLGDKGVEMLSRGLYDQARKDSGLQVLILCNNNLTRRCVDTISTIIDVCPLIEAINIGNNDLTDGFIYHVKQSLEQTKTLTSLGLQSTLITCHGILILTEALEVNTSLRNLNLRGNKAIQPTSLNTLANVIHRTSLINIDIDDNNRTCINPQTYVEIVNKVRQMVAVNRARLREESQLVSQDQFEDNWLSCEPDYVPKSLLRTLRAPYAHRFTVAPVSEIASTPRPSTSHRFTVVPIGGGDSENARHNKRKKSVEVDAAGDAGSSQIPGESETEGMEIDDCDVEVENTLSGPLTEEVENTPKDAAKKNAMQSKKSAKLKALSQPCTDHSNVPPNIIEESLLVIDDVDMTSDEVIFIEKNGDKN